MNNSVVGASILNIITESLYDKPIVVFREYVQNSADSLSLVNKDDKETLCNYIWHKDDNLYFLDNGVGINPEIFLTKMESIAFSTKEKTTNMGYKGIGRLSGISYCKKLHFINIIDYNSKTFQTYTIDCVKYNEIQKSDNYNEMSFSELMKNIGTINLNNSSEDIDSIISPYKNIFESRSTGFLVILEQLSPVLKTVIKEKNFEESLSWLLPVPFREDLLSKESKTSSLFDWLSNKPVFDNTSVIAAQGYRICFNNKQIFRPLNENMFRTYLCRSRFDNYAVCIHSFSNEKIEIDKKNTFSGIRIYIDNMLLCDENELIPVLQQYGYTSHGLYELIQTVRGVGVMIYIVDKINISANARRTFIELTDQDSLNFLELISEFVENIYDTRYALSHYVSALKKEEVAEEVLSEKKEKAQRQLELLASDEIKVQIKNEDRQVDFEQLSKVEQKRIIKSKLTKGINESVKQYLAQTDYYNLDTCIDDFRLWYTVN